MPNTPININPIDLQPDVAIGVALPMDSANGSGLQSTYFTKDQVKSNMRNLFSTMIGERVMQPTFGTFLYNLLFEQSTTGLKEKQIRQEVDNKYIKVMVKYTIPNFNLEDEITLEIQ